MSANDIQVGGDHYKDKAIQPWDYITSNGLGYLEGCIVKYVSRYQDKGGAEDLKKARHYLDKLIEVVSAIEKLRKQQLPHDVARCAGVSNDEGQLVVPCNSCKRILWAKSNEGHLLWLNPPPRQGAFCSLYSFVGDEA